MSEAKVSYAATGNNIEERLAKTQRTLVGLFIFIVGLPVIWGFITSARSTFIKEVEISNIQAVSSTSLCPGDKLILSYDLKVRGEGRLIIDQTVWRVDPPKTVIFSNSRRFILGSALEHSLQEAWIVPKTFFNYDVAEPEYLPPGQYRRYISISSPTYTNAQDVDSIDFTIRKDC